MPAEPHFARTSNATTTKCAVSRLARETTGDHYPVTGSWRCCCSEISQRVATLVATVSNQSRQTCFLAVTLIITATKSGTVGVEVQALRVSLFKLRCSAIQLLKP